MSTTLAAPAVGLAFAPGAPQSSYADGAVVLWSANGLGADAWLVRLAGRGLAHGSIAALSHFGLAEGATCVGAAGEGAVFGDSQGRLWYGVAGRQEAQEAEWRGKGPVQAVANAGRRSIVGLGWGGAVMVDWEGGGVEVGRVETGGTVNVVGWMGRQGVVAGEGWAGSWDEREGRMRRGAMRGRGMNVAEWREEEAVVGLSGGGVAVVRGGGEVREVEEEEEEGRGGRWVWRGGQQSVGVWEGGQLRGPAAEEARLAGPIQAAAYLERLGVLAAGTHKGKLQLMGVGGGR